MNEEAKKDIRTLVESRYLAYRDYETAMLNLSGARTAPEDYQRMFNALARVQRKYRDLEQAAHDLEWLSGGKASPDWTLPPDLELKWMED